MRKLFTAILLMLIFSNCINAQIKYGDNKDAGHYINTRGIKLYYEIYGKGEPLLFIHGNCGAIDNFNNNIPYFSQHYKVIAG